MSGRIVTIILLTTCISIAGFALWRRALKTRGVSNLWTPAGAQMIQHADAVLLRFGKADEAASDLQWHDISHARGLIHVRAILVDDRYFQWETQPRLGSENAPTATACFRFASIGNPATETIDVEFDVDSGFVFSPKTRIQVRLIPTSQRAIGEYLIELQKSLAE